MNLSRRPQAAATKGGSRKERWLAAMMNGGSGNSASVSTRKRHISLAATLIEAGPTAQASRCLSASRRGGAVPSCLWRGEFWPGWLDTHGRLRHARTDVCQVVPRSVAASMRILLTSASSTGEKSE